MRNRNIYFSLILLALLWVALWQATQVYSYSLPYNSRAPRQEAPPVTPQPPQPDGSIIHEVRPGDTLWAISIAYGVDVEEIRRLNNIPPEVGNIYYGQKLIIKLAPEPSLPPNATIIVVTAGSPSVATTEAPAATVATNSAATEVSTEVATDAVAAPETPTEIPSPTPLPTEEKLEPTATLIPLVGKAEVCITAFDDTNKNHWRDSDEALLADVELTFTQGSTTSQQVKTSADDPTCTSDLQAGILSVSAVPPASYGLTTSGQLEVEIKTGEKVALAIGAAEGYTLPAEATSAVVDEATPAPAVAQGNIIDTVLNNSGLVVLALAGLIFIGGSGVVLLARRG